MELFAGPMGDFVTGQVLRVDGGHSCGLADERFLNFSWHRNRNETVGGVEIVRAALVNDSQISVSGCCFIEDRPVDFVLLQRCLVIGVVDTDYVRIG